MNNIDKIPSLIRDLYSITQQLEDLFPGRAFTLDGHLVGSIGEVLAKHQYGLKLLPASTETHDAISQNGLKVQIKATQRKSIGLRSRPDHMIVLKILPDGTTNEVYNGPGSIAWENSGKQQKNGQRTISVSKLSKLMSEVPLEQRLLCSKK